MPLTRRQERFVAEYVSCLNGKQAAIRAGYSRTSAQQLATNMLATPAIQAAVAAETESYLKRVEVSTEKTLRELALIAYADHADYYCQDDKGRPIVDLRNVPPGGSKVIAEVTNKLTEGGDGKPDVREVKIKLHSKTVALDMLCRYLGLLKDKSDDAGNDEARQLAAAIRATLDARRTGPAGANP